MILTENSFLLQAAMAFNDPNATSTEDFLEDVRRIKHLKKLFGQYKKTGEMNERLIMNHIRILFNVFEASTLVRLLAFRLEDQLDCLIPFIRELGFLPNRITLLKEEGFEIITGKVMTNPGVEDRIRKILR